MKRLRFDGIDWDGHFQENGADLPRWVQDKNIPEFFRVLRGMKTAWGHGGDEYGNCTLYFRCPLFGVIWWYPTGHYQTEIEVPEPGVSKWVDRIQYGGCDEQWCKHDD